MTVAIKPNKNIETRKTIEVDNVQIEEIKVVTNISNPENINLIHYISNQTLYKANHAEIRAVETAAEGKIYTEQGAVTAELAGGNKDAA